MLTVACVLRSGGDYRPEHVLALRDGIERHLSLKYQFVCLSDKPLKQDRLLNLPLKHDWPGWWAKMNLFAPDYALLSAGPVLYLDLDTIIAGPLDDIATGHRFTVLRDFLAAGRIGSGVMAWDANLAQIYHRFAKAPERFMREFRTGERWGDQGFIRIHTPVDPERWQDKHPGRVVSFKVDCVPRRGVPFGASIVAFHGKPRPWAMTEQQRAWFDTETMVEA